MWRARGTGIRRGMKRASNPYDGETEAAYTGPKPPYEFLEVDKKYSWVKAPRYDGMAMEVGPLARVLVAYVSGDKRTKELVDGALSKLGVTPTALFSTLGRWQPGVWRRNSSPR
jgi:Ni,Fe-hydrogenase I large subunit